MGPGKVTREEEGAGVDLADALVKALWRRAEAYEGKEKWDAARQDWEAIAGKDFAGKARMEAVKGVGRCRKMLSAGTDGAGTGAGDRSAPSARPTPKPRPRPAPAVVVPTDAVDRVREANQAAEAEAQQKHELKDVVDVLHDTSIRIIAEKRTLLEGGKFSAGKDIISILRKFHVCLVRLVFG